MLYWTGDNALRELQQAGITQQCFPILLECATKAIKAASEAESIGNYLSGLSAIVLEELFSSLCYLFSENGGRANDYQLALQKYIKKDNRNTVNGWICKLSLWCLNPSVIFKEIADLCLSVILTSGTLSPMGSFASELGVQFEACMDAPHVIDVESQLWAAIIPSGPTNCRLNASYKTADAYAFQDDLGASLEEICKSVKGGALVFFPSYKLLEKLQNRWRQTGQWSRLNAQKPIFTEPRGTSEELDIVLQKYYDAIRGTKKSKHLKVKLASKQCSKHLTDKNNSDAAREGAAFLAVCRGKVSEGIDFSDDNARVVVIVGIPFPNINDIVVGLKKKYNDTYRLSKGLLNGSEWYCHQAFRALNQAAGRCIRHRFDYGAIIFLDERFKEERNVTYISKWIKNSIKQFSSFEESLLGLKNFFENAEKQFRPKSNHRTIKDDVLESKLFNLDHKKNLSCSKLDAFDQKMEQKMSQKIKKEINQNAMKRNTNKPNKPTTPVDKCSSLCSKMNNCREEGGRPEGTDFKPLDRCTESNDNKNHERYTETTFTIASDNSDHPIMPEVIIIGDDAALKGRLANNEDGCAIVNASSPLIESPLSPTAIPYGTVSEGTCVSSVTPERRKLIDPHSAQKESSLNTSVNSNFQKRKKLSHSQLSDCNIINDFSSPDRAESFCQVGFASSRSAENSKHLIPSQAISLRNEGLEKDAISQKRIEISCTLCKSTLGLREDNFQVTCSFISSSKVYLVNLFNKRTSSVTSLECCTGTHSRNIPVILCDSSAVGNQILLGNVKGATPRHGVWSEEDGCVFKEVICPHCTAHNTCLGAQIIATDASNSHLLNKVLFFSDKVEIKDVPAPIKEVTIPKYTEALPEVSGLFQKYAYQEIKKYAYDSPRQEICVPGTRRSKLSLPRRRQLS